MLSRRKLFGFLAAAPVAAVALTTAAPAYHRGGYIKGRPYRVGERGIEHMISNSRLASVSANSPVAGGTITIRLSEWPSIKLVGEST
ncbi:MAG: hypothetical protein K0S56_529 [Microvirga sp.]|jgi:hypothetical protein|nr:hypothetical protein [Microvirga sp.]